MFISSPAVLPDVFSLNVTQRRIFHHDGRCLYRLLVLPEDQAHHEPSPGKEAVQDRANQGVGEVVSVASLSPSIELDNNSDWLWDAVNHAKSFTFDPSIFDEVPNGLKDSSKDPMLSSQAQSVDDNPQASVPARVATLAVDLQQNQPQQQQQQPQQQQTQPQQQQTIKLQTNQVPPKLISLPKSYILGKRVFKIPPKPTGEPPKQPRLEPSAAQTGQSPSSQGPTHAVLVHPDSTISEIFAVCRKCCKLPGTEGGKSISRFCGKANPNPHFKVNITVISHRPNLLGKSVLCDVCRWRLSSDYFAVFRESLDFSVSIDSGKLGVEIDKNGEVLTSGEYSISMRHDN